jgi:hypothetical protein
LNAKGEIMNAVAEVFPMLAGVFVGLVCAAIPSATARKCVWAVLTVVFGAAATVLSGEYQESWGFVLLDMLWVGGISVAVWLGVNVYRRRLS